MPELSIKETKIWKGKQLHKDTCKHRAECVWETVDGVTTHKGCSRRENMEEKIGTS